jgi:hypothetical protein
MPLGKFHEYEFHDAAASSDDRTVFLIKTNGLFERALVISDSQNGRKRRRSSQSLQALTLTFDDQGRGTIAVSDSSFPFEVQSPEAGRGGCSCIRQVVKEPRLTSCGLVNHKLRLTSNSSAPSTNGTHAATSVRGNDRARLFD